ncbi:MAG: AAA family ATPase [Solirubrobacterales bacterium]|nr:AAA family ATPase [Solirubrobacterales bacterium]
MLEGRARELGWLAERIERVAHGGHCAVLVRGEAGVGKSALLDAAVEAAAVERVLRARGYESEREIPFAGLHELATPLLGLRDRLPAPQRRSLESALALEPPTPHDRFAVPAALLGLLAHAADEAPLLAVVDDLHWIDDASRDALLFVARRLAVGGAGLLLAARDQGAAPFDAAGVETLALGGLDAGSSRRLLAGSWPDVSGTVADALVGATAGNPLALIELPGALDADQRAGRAPLHDPLPSPAAIEAVYATRVAALPATAQRALTVAAAMSRGRIETFAAAARGLGLPDDALGPAERAGLVAIDARVTFGHPLMRAAAYHAASSADRRAVHAALASVAGDGRRRAWHLAHAAAEADAGVAAQLEEAARDARARGGHAEAARAFLRAADLSADAVSRGRRALAAAQDAAVAGQSERALDLLDTAEPLVEPRLLPAIARLRGNLARRRGDLRASQLLLEQAADDAAAAGAHVPAAALLLESSVSHAMAGDTPGLLAVLDRARAQTDLAGAPEPGLTIVRIMAAVSRAVHGEAPSVSPELDALEAAVGSLDPIQLSEPIGLMAHASLWMGELDRAGRLTGSLVGRHREAGALGALPYPLTVSALLADRVGDWTRGHAEAEEAARLAEDVGHATIEAFCLATLARVEGGRGLFGSAREHAAAGIARSEAAGASTGVIYNLAAVGRLELADDRAEQAVEALDEAARRQVEMQWLEPRMALDAADHVEALVRVGRRADAQAARERLAQRAAATGGAWSHAAAERCALLLAADADDQDRHAAAALAWHQRDGMPFERARTELAWGERLRRRRQRMRAREPLSRAHAEFARLGAAPWAARARHELEAAGGVAAGAAAPDDGLSAHERKVALMVSHGMTNREVAAALFLSPKTIERHLSQIYRSLGVRSRTELARLMSRGSAQ